MPTIAFTAPLLPGMAELDREVMQSFQTGERKTDYEEARRRAGITRESVWIQTTPAGDLAIIYLEADDLAAAFTTLGKSNEPFDQWFRDHSPTRARILTRRRLPHPGTGPGLPQLTASFETRQPPTATQLGASRRARSEHLAPPL